MHIIEFLFIGLIAGWIATSFVRGHGSGFIRDVVLGITGAFIGGFLFNAMNISSNGFWSSLSMAVVGAVTLLLVVELLSRPRRLALARKENL